MSVTVGFSCILGRSALGRRHISATAAANMFARKRSRPFAAIERCYTQDCPMKLADLQKGAYIPLDRGCPADQLPEWLDMDKFKRGQAFYLKHVRAITFASFCAVVAGFSIDTLLGPLQFTKNSDTPARAQKRYTHTFLYGALWQIGNVWGGDKEEAFKSVQRVRQMHSRVAEKMNKTLPDGSLYFSQYDMALVQSSYFGLAIRYPKRFGIRCSKEELEDYIHLWRGLGYLLGLDDKYNICSDGTYEATYAICKEIETNVLKPAMNDLPEGFGEMADDVVKGMNMYVGFPMYTKEAIIEFSFGRGIFHLPKLGNLDMLRVLQMRTVAFLCFYIHGVEWVVNRIPLYFYRKSLALIR